MKKMSEFIPVRDNRRTADGRVGEYVLRDFGNKTSLDYTCNIILLLFARRNVVVRDNRTTRIHNKYIIACMTINTFTDLCRLKYQFNKL